MNKIQHVIVFALIISIVTAITACNLPAAAPNLPPAPAEISVTPTLTAVESPTPTSTPAPANVACTPTLITNTDANVRNGPSQAYGVYGILPQGSVANIAGRNTDGSWWYIEFAAGDNGHGWIAGSITTASCVPPTLAIIIPPPEPVIPNTPTPIPGAPSSTPTTVSGGGIILVPVLPPLLLYKSPTPTLILPVLILPHIPIGPIINP